MARVNALRAKSAENEKAKEAAKQAVSSQEKLTLLSIGLKNLTSLTNCQPMKIASN